MQTTERYAEAVGKAKDKALYALNDLCDKLDGLDDMRGSGGRYYSIRNRRI